MILNDIVRLPLSLIVPGQVGIWNNKFCCFLCQYLQVTQATNQIVMNCADIDIITASFAPEGGEGECQPPRPPPPPPCFITNGFINENVVCSRLI